MGGHDVNRTDCGAYLLAAGKGSRAGSPKAWQLHAGRSLLETQVEFLSQLVLPGQIAVSIQPDWRPRCLELQPDVQWVDVDPGATPLGALQTLLRQAPLSRWSFLHHVDMPVWETGLFEQLVAATHSEAALAVIPVHKGRGGHPVLLAPACHAQLLALDPREDRLDHWFRRVPVARIEVPYACIHANWNLGPPVA